MTGVDDGVFGFVEGVGGEVDRVHGIELQRRRRGFSLVATLLHVFEHGLVSEEIRAPGSRNYWSSGPWN